MISLDYDEASSQLMSSPNAHFINTNSKYFKTSPAQESKSSKKEKESINSKDKVDSRRYETNLSPNSGSCVHIGLRCGAARGGWGD